LVVIYGPFFVVATIAGYDHPEILPTIIIHCAFMLIMSVMIVTIAGHRKKLKQKEASHRIALASELKNRAIVIESKTRESVQLRQLSRQFSPQVVQAIVESRISMDGGLQLTPICSLFVDVVGSTERIVHIDSRNFNVAISRFIDDSTKTLIKHDLTIDKFLGDGFMAFSNAPIPSTNFVDRALLASLEIISEVKANQDFYLSCWGQPFQIRLGLATGVASVGFHGGGDSFKCYTALGESVNLSARLCSEATPGSILISGRTHDLCSENLKSRFIKVEEKLSLKGFEGIALDVYSFPTRQTKPTLNILPKIA